MAETLLVYSDRVATAGKPAPTRMRLAVPTSGPVPVGSATPVHVLDGEREISGGSPDILWQGPATNGIGFVNQKGYFHCRQARHGGDRGTLQRALGGRADHGGEF